MLVLVAGYQDLPLSRRSRRAARPGPHPTAQQPPLRHRSRRRSRRPPRHISSPQSRGAKLGHFEDSIATLDMLQSKAVIETVDGVQRIRGLAGSGKTIVLALKAGGTAIFDATASMRLRLPWA